MRYGRAIKESVLKRVLPPNAESIRSVSVDVRIAEQTIRNWIAKVDQGILGDDVQLGPRQLGATGMSDSTIITVRAAHDFYFIVQIKAAVIMKL
jgi:transposase-like protein